MPRVSVCLTRHEIGRDFSHENENVDFCRECFDHELDVDLLRQEIPAAMGITDDELENDIAEARDGGPEHPCYSDCDYQCANKHCRKPLTEEDN